MTLEEYLVLLGDDRLGVVVVHGTESEHDGRYLSIMGYLYPEPELWAEGGASVTQLETFVTAGLQWVATLIVNTLGIR